MRAGLLRQQIEIWDSKISINEFGIQEHQKEMFLQCPAATKFIKNEEAGKDTISTNTVVEFTIRHNRYFKTPTKSMFIRWDGAEWDIIHTDNYFSLNKYVTLTAVKRSK
ncbi:MAG: phage head completion protein [Aeromonas veronii]